MKAHKINKEVMGKIENNGLCKLSYKELIEITGGEDPERPWTDIGYVMGKIGGWIKNVFTLETRDEWMLEVDPKTLYG